MSNAKKLYKDTVYTSAESAAHDLAAMRASIAEVFGFDPLTEEQNGAPVFRTNLTADTATDENGEAYEIPPIGEDESGALVFADHTRGNNLAIVTLYEGQHQPDPSEQPLAIPRAVYLVALPTLDTMKGERRLAEYMRALVAKDQLSQARKIAKRDHEQKARLVADPVAQLIAAAASASGSATEKAFKIMFPGIQHMLVSRAETAAERMKSAGQHANARLILATYSKSRLSRTTLKECFESAEAAEHHFPSMPQEQWVTILRKLAEMAPDFPVSVIQRDEAGKSLKDDEGKVVRRIEKQALSPTFYLDAIANRDAKPLELDDAPALTFDGLSMD
jgi:hypothetical protein